MIREKRFTLAADPTKTYVPPTAKEAVPFLNFSPLQNAIARLEKAATTFSTLQNAGERSGTGLEALNRVIYRMEQYLLSDKGLPRRAWYRHTIYAPGCYTGYGVKTLPGIREAIEQRNWPEAQEQIGIAATALDGYSAALEEVSKGL
jgi:N-acetylated-alpha-linked acidic dipeptidase